MGDKGPLVEFHLEVSSDKAAVRASSFQSVDFEEAAREDCLDFMSARSDSKSELDSSMSVSRAICALWPL